MQRFRCVRCLQKFAAVHSSVFNHFNQERHIYPRDNFKLNRVAALAEWRGLGVKQGAAALSRQRRVRIRLPAPPPNTHCTKVRDPALWRHQTGSKPSRSAFSAKTSAQVSMTLPKVRSASRPFLQTRTILVSRIDSSSAITETLSPLLVSRSFG